MLKDVEELPWNSHFKGALRKEINETYNKVMKDGYLMNPALYMLKCKVELHTAPAGQASGDFGYPPDVICH